MKSAEGFDLVRGNYVYYIESGKVEKQRIRGFSPDGEVLFDGKMAVVGILPGLCWVDERNALSALRDHGSEL